MNYRCILIKNGTDPFILQNGSKLNCLLYADDLVILSKSKQGMEKCLKILECFTTKRLLDINYKKTKIIIFQKTGRKPKNISFYINNTQIDIVQEYTYLGITISSSENLTVAQKVLAEKALNAIFKIRKHIDFSRLPLRSARQIFETAIKPILTYGSEVWGAYVKQDFEKWDKTPIEKTHLRFCKMFLGLNRRASNHASRGEMGSYPIQITILKHIYTYYQYLNSKDDSTFVKQAFYIMLEHASKLKNSYYNNLVEFLRLSKCYHSDKLENITESIIREIIRCLKETYSEHWKMKISTSTRLEFYSKIKKDFVEDPFLNTVQNFDAKKDYFKLKTSNHSLLVETGRYCRPILPRENRICKFCRTNDIEDEIHLLFECQMYSELRETLFEKIRACNVNLPKDLKDIPFLFTSGNHYLTKYIAYYIHRCFSKRKREMKMIE